MVAISSVTGNSTMGTQHFLVIFIFNHCLQLIGVVSATLFLIVSWKLSLHKTKSLLLLHSLVICDFVYFTLGLPYTVYLTSNWNPVILDYDPLIMFITSVLIMAHMKANLIILIGIACDRVMAIYFPTFYRFMNHRKYTAVIVSLAIFAGTADYVTMWIMSPVYRHPGCSAVGCFVSDAYRIIWGTTNGLMGLSLMIITLLIIVRLKFMANAHLSETQTREYQQFQKANRVAMCSLLSGLFITTPSIFVGFFQFDSVALFKAIGPFYLSCLLVAGCCNNVTQLLLNKDLSTGCKSLFSTTSTAVREYTTQARYQNGSSS